MVGAPLIRAGRDTDRGAHLGEDRAGPASRLVRIGRAGCRVEIVEQRSDLVGHRRRGREVGCLVEESEHVEEFPVAAEGREHGLGVPGFGSPIGSIEHSLRHVLAGAEAVEGRASLKPAFAKVDMDRAAEAVVEVRAGDVLRFVDREIGGGRERQRRAAQPGTVDAVGPESGAHGHIGNASDRPTRYGPAV